MAHSVSGDILHQLEIKIMPPEMSIVQSDRDNSTIEGPSSQLI